jgi:molybdopterin-containing oxidoreductase family membrane subunit
MAKIVLVTSFLTSYGYLSEQTLSWYGHEKAEHYVYLNRLLAFDQYAVLAWCVCFCNTIAPQLFWIPRLRRNQTVLVVVSLLVLLGMWLERYVIIVTSLHRDYLPSSWGMFQPTIFDFLTFFGSIGLFLSAFLLFARLLPMLSMSELRGLLPGAHGPEEGR